MRRVILATVGTVIAVVALLSFKSHPAQQSSSAALPSATLPSARGATTAAPATRPSPSTSSSGPPNRSGTTTGGTRATTPPNTAVTSRTVVGSTVHTRYGIVQVKVVVAAKRITAVSFAQLTAFDGRSAQINSQAGPQLLQETLTSQSAHVDGVSGATYTSDGYRTSLQYALDQVGIR